MWPQLTLRKMILPTLPATQQEGFPEKSIGRETHFRSSQYVYSFGTILHEQAKVIRFLLIWIATVSAQTSTKTFFASAFAPEKMLIIFLIIGNDKKFDLILF